MQLAKRVEGSRAKLTISFDICKLWGCFKQREYEVSLFSESQIKLSASGLVFRASCSSRNGHAIDRLPLRSRICTCICTCVYIYMYT